jgi:uncharacterized protein YjbI with pentapeptide repeats
VKLLNLDKQTLRFGWVVTQLPASIQPHHPGVNVAFFVKGTYKLEHGQPAGRWPGKPDQPSGDAAFHGDKALGPGYASDFVPYKARADFALVGTAHPTPSQVPLGCFEVGVRIGSLHKELVVWGPRQWLDGALRSKPGPPGPVEPVALSYANAWGGADYPTNPIGKGMIGYDMHRIGLRHRRVVSRDTPNQPGGFAPIPPNWPQRAGKVGTYGGDWLESRWPWLPKDFDWTFFNAVPEDQLFESYLVGDEAIRLEGLRPEREIYESDLPGQRARLFLTQRSARGEAFHEVPLVLDTVWIDADNEKLVLVWRGRHPVATIKLRDIANVLITTEPLASSPPPIDHYRIIRDEQTNFAVPLPPGEALPDAAAIRAEVEAAVASAQSEFTAKLDAEKEKGFQAAEEALKNQLTHMDAIAEELAESERSTRMAFSKTGISEAPAQRHTDLQAAVAAARQKVTDSLGGLRTPPAPDDTTVHDHLRSTLASLANIPQIAAAEGVTLPPAYLASLDKAKTQIEALLPSLANVPMQSDFEEKASALEAEILAQLPPDLRRKSPEPGSRIDLDAARREGLYGMDLSGFDLSGLDLSHIDFHQSDLSHANLSHANLASANLEGAILSETTLTAANLTGAKLKYVGFSSAKVDGVTWTGSDLRHARFNKMTLPQTDFSGVNASFAQFNEANLTGAKFRKAILEFTSFRKATLEKADFTEANLTNTKFAAAKASGATLDRCQMFQTRITKGATFTKASFRHIYAPRSIWMEAILDDATFAHATLTDAMFASASLKRAQIDRCDISRAEFSDARLDEAHLTCCNLIQSKFNRANLTDARLDRSNLYGSGFWEANLHHARWDGANILRSTLVQ